jgi:hypothetical protein
MRAILCSMMVALVLATTGAHGQGVQMRGTASCGNWIEERARDDGSRITKAFINEVWVIGYLSGMAAANNRNFWGRRDVNSLDNQSVFLWIDNYCRANPLKRMDDAADALFLERCPTATSCR